MREDSSMEQLAQKILAGGIPRRKHDQGELDAIRVMEGESRQGAECGLGQWSDLCKGFQRSFQSEFGVGLGLGGLAIGVKADQLWTKTFLI